MFRAWIEKNTLLPPGNFCNCIFRLDIGCAGLHTRSLDPDFCLCHLLKQKNKTFNNITVQREKERQGAHSVWFQHDTVIPYIMPYSWNLFLRRSENWKGLIQRREVDLSMLLTSPHHTRGPSFAVFRVTLFLPSCISFWYTKLCLDDDDHLLLDMKLNLIRCNRCSCT